MAWPIMKFGRLRFVLFLALLASNLLIGVISLLYLRSMEQRYAALFDRSVPIVNHLRTLTRELGSVQRLARRISDPTNEAAWAALLPRMDDESNRAHQHAIEITALGSLGQSAHAAVISRAGQDYDEKVDQFLALARAGRIGELNRFNTDALRPAYDQYMDALDATGSFVEREGSDLRARYAQDSRLFGGFLLAFAGWPLLAAGVVILVMSLLVIGLFVAVFFPKLFVSKQRAA
jgi:hypothetical protein